MKTFKIVGAVIVTAWLLSFPAVGAWVLWSNEAWFGGIAVLAWTLFIWFTWALALGKLK